MDYIEEHKVLFGTHMLSEEAEDWWDNTCQILEVTGTEVTLVVSRVQFLEKYFSKDERIKKEIEFLELKQGNSTVVEYAAKFEELVKYFPHYNKVVAKGSMCINFESGIRPKIKQVVGYQEIDRFCMLVNKCIIYDKYNITQSTHYKSISERKGKGNFRRKWYGVIGHYANEYSSAEKKCYKCEKKGNLIAYCKCNDKT
ncbi:uncharacterized protein LOC127103147 [Lathyrus oleraceus]|uniref:uncharacterized protein LOC127103147 n=1 Tax=Pisum sativum TaxID=3888 RepID=UPI0021D187E0|nr:uncharacterized protein LOC127103147 [Pisum sativum]